MRVRARVPLPVRDRRRKSAQVRKEKRPSRTRALGASATFSNLGYRTCPYSCPFSELEALTAYTLGCLFNVAKITLPTEL